VAGTKANSALDISTRDLVFALLLAKGAAVLVALAVAFGRGEYENLALTVASLVAVGAFISLITLAGRCSLRQLLEATRPVRPVWGARSTVAWVLLAIIAGILLRFGNGGLVVGVFRVIDPARADAEVLDALSAFSDPKKNGVSWLFFANVVAGAVDEEFIYRRVLQWRFCESYGLTPGILIVSVIFCAMHLGSPTTIMAGVFFSLLYVFAGRLWVPIIAHATANLVLPALSSLRFTTNASSLSLLMYVSALLLCVALVTMFIAIRGRSVRPYEPRGGARVDHANAAPK
jgi:membrane protease YdiL (CAAX protease family)